MTNKTIFTYVDHNGHGKIMTTVSLADVTTIEYDTADQGFSITVGGRRTNLPHDAYEAFMSAFTAYREYADMPFAEVSSFEQGTLGEVPHENEQQVHVHRIDLMGVDLNDIEAVMKASEATARAIEAIHRKDDAQPEDKVAPKLYAKELLPERLDSHHGAPIREAIAFGYDEARVGNRQPDAGPTIGDALQALGWCEKSYALASGEVAKRNAQIIDLRDQVKAAKSVSYHVAVQTLLESDWLGDGEIAQLRELHQAGWEMRFADKPKPELVPKLASHLLVYGWESADLFKRNQAGEQNVDHGVTVLREQLATARGNSEHNAALARNAEVQLEAAHREIAELRRLFKAEQDITAERLAKLNELSAAMATLRGNVSRDAKAIQALASAKKEMGTLLQVLDTVFASTSQAPQLKTAQQMVDEVRKFAPATQSLRDLAAEIGDADEGKPKARPRTGTGQYGATTEYDPTGAGWVPGKPVADDGL